MFHALVLAALTTQTQTIDAERSQARFTVSHIFVEHVTGSVPISGGRVVLVGGSPVPISVTARLDAARIETGDPDRDSALRSADFFDTQKFPEWTFVSTKIVSDGPDAFTMDGDLTIHGVTRPEVLHVTVSGGAANPAYHATGEIDRHAFGMATTRLDPAIGASAAVTLDVVLK